MENIYFSLALKTKQKKPKKVDFKFPKCDLTHLNRIFNVTLKNARNIRNRKWKKTIKILRLLDVVIPDEYFGTRCHRKLFYGIVEKILTQSAFECIYLSTITKGYNYNSVPWLTKIENSLCETLLLKSNLFLLEIIVKPLITFHYKAMKTYNGQEIQFIWLDDWCSFQTRALTQLEKSGAITETKDAENIKTRGYLKIIPKGALSEPIYRPIVNIFRNPDKLSLKILTKKIYAASRNYNKHLSTSLYDDWASFLKRVGDQDIFGIKMDVEDAYGNVNISALCSIIRGLPPKIFEKHHKKLLLDYVHNQFVVFKKKVYQWKRGLLQGDVLSAALCELYMTHCDNIFLEKFEDMDFFHRTVDDYFFCSTEEFKVARFESYLQTVHKINTSKTKSNLSYNQEIPYCGKLFNLKTKEVRAFYHFKEGYEIRNKFKLWNFRRPIPESNSLQFLRKAVSYSFISNYLSKMELNTVFNSQRVVLENFFDSMVYVAYKFDATVMALRNTCKDFNFVNAVMEECIKKCALKVRDTIRRNKGIRYKIKITFRLLTIIAYKAFLVVLRRRSEIYKNLILQIKTKHDLKMDFRDADVNFDYFHRLPKSFQKVKVSRKVRI